MVEEYSPMKRGLKGSGIMSTIRKTTDEEASRAVKVEEYSPMKRGLKVKYNLAVRLSAEWLKSIPQ